VLTHSTGGLRLAGVKLDPRALRALLHIPLTELRDNTVPCSDLSATGLADLEDAVAGVTSAERLVRVFDRFFLTQLAGEGMVEPVIQCLLRSIRASRGSQSILQWAREQCVDPRTLERRFVASMGMTPKQYARIERFKHSYRRLTTHRPDDRKLHLEAYYDESHFSREFRHFLGTTPMHWRNGAATRRTAIGDHLLEAEFAT
jgi:transcriptional regulator GlxA family with amidase domain